jgi:hypothetical protein
VAEAGQVSLLAHDVGEGTGRAVALGDGEELVRALAGAAVERPGERRQPGSQCVVEVGAHRRGHAHGHRRGGELVVGHEHQGSVDGIGHTGRR